MNLALFEFSGMIVGATIAIIVIMLVIKFSGKLKTMIIATVLVLILSISLRYLIGGEFWSNFFIGSQSLCIPALIVFWRRC